MDKYEVIGLLGEGSFGRVYKAKQISDNNFVALKVISKRGRSHKELKDLRGECEIQRHLHHPNIIQMLDSFETENEIVVITEFAQKELNTILGKEGYLSEDRVRTIVWDLVSALYYLHSHRVLHRDLKPQNILIDSMNRAKLCDFGFARNMSTGTHVLTSIKGTPLYMAPELIEEQPYDHNADLWSLGCIVYELLVGAPPFCTASILHLIRLIKHEQIQWPTFISDECVSFLKGLLQKNPTKRFTWQEILNHPFVKGHIILMSEDTSKPLTKTMSANTLQIKEQQRKDFANKKSTKSADNSASLNDSKNNEVMKKMANLSLNDEKKKPFEIKQKLDFIEEIHPIESDEWLVFLQKSMEELMNNELTSLLQLNLTNILVSPLRNSNSSSKVKCYVVQLFFIPFTNELKNGQLDDVSKVYLDVKLVPNLVYSIKLLMRDKIIDDLNDEDFLFLENNLTLIAYLTHWKDAFLNQFCDAIGVLKIYGILRNLLQINKIRLRIILDLISILTNVMRKIPDSSQLIDDIILHEPLINIADYLRHFNSTLRERTCIFLYYILQTLPESTVRKLWNVEIKDILETLMFDSLETVRMVAERTVEELKNKKYYE